MTGLVDVHGMPLRRDVLTREVAAPTLPVSASPRPAIRPMA